MRRISAKVFSIFMSALLAFNIAPSVSFAESGSSLPFKPDFSSEIGKAPSEMDYIVEDGSITVESYYGRNVIYVKNNSDGKPAQLSKQFDPVSDTGIAVQFSYMQRYAKQDDATVFALTSGSKEIINLKTKNGDIVSVGKDGTTGVIVEKYSANKWYDFSFDIDLKEKTFAVSVNSGKTFKNLSFYTDSASADGIKFMTRYSPGFAIADIAVATDEKSDVMEISGSDTMNVRKSSDSVYEYEAVLYDNFGNKVKNAEYSWSTYPQTINGIGKSTDGGKITFTVGSTSDYRGVVTLSVTANGITAVKYITVVNQQIAEMSFEGAYKIAYGVEDGNSFALDINMYSKDSELLDDEAVEWKITCNTDGVTFTKEPSRLIITVSKELPNMDVINIKAVLKSNKSIIAERNIYTYPSNLYNIDKSRFDTMLESVDYLTNTLAKNPCNDAPLFSSYINLKAGRPYLVPSWFDGYKYVTNLANDSVMYKVFDALTAVTGDEKYTEMTDATYNWYLKNEIDEKSHLGFWGGHCMVYLDTLKEQKARRGPNDPNATYQYHELKDHAFYWNPFFRLNQKKATEMVRGVWNAHVMDWSNLMFNRHGVYGQTHSDNGNWAKAYEFNPPTEFVRLTEGVGFRSSANDFASAAAELYAETGDENAKRWAYNILASFYSLRNPETHIAVTQFTTAHRAKGAQDPDVIYPGWWKEERNDGPATLTTMGDRFFNQFADDLVAQGFYTEEDKKTDKMTEGNMASFQANSILKDFYVAERLGDDTEEGKMLKKYATQHTAGYLRYFWIENTNTFKYGMIDGTDLYDFYPNRNGYYGTGYYGAHRRYNNGTMKSTDVNRFYLACKCYRYAVTDPELADDAKILKKFIDYYANSVYRIGSIGNETIGDDGTKLEKSATYSHPLLILCLIDLYKASGNKEFLSLARNIATNFYNEYYINGVYFSPSLYIANKPTVEPGGNYIYLFGGTNALGYHALIALEATLCGIEDKIPQYEIFEGYYEEYFRDEYDNALSSTDRDWISSCYLPDVNIEKVYCEDEIHLKVGEERALEFGFYPEDYTEDENIACVNKYKNTVHYNEKNSSVIGKSKGEAELIFYAGSNRVEHRVRVIVEEE